MADFDYVVIGSGAGGGPVAANLAQAGFRVLLLEAGTETKGEVYGVPAFHAHASQTEEMRWDYFVRHLPDPLQTTDSKYVETYRGERVDGVLYPRAAGLGGCTTHHAMITVYPHDSDWRRLEQLTGDAGWSPAEMRQLFQRIERCQHALPDDPSAKHGYDGWLPTHAEDPRTALGDTALTKIVVAAAIETKFDNMVQRFGSPGSALGALLRGKAAFKDALIAISGGDDAGLKSLISAKFDPNDATIPLEGREEGVFLVPVSVDMLGNNKGVRAGSRERILQVKLSHPDKLEIRTGCFATRIIFEGNKAVGVKYVEGERLYEAAPAPAAGRAAPGPEIEVRVAREVIISCGAFNTPQLLMLSGVGPKDQLEPHGIAPILPDTYWEGVGKNLQDRYEVGVVTEMKDDFETLGDCTFLAPQPGEGPDACLQKWRRREPSIYSGNGAVVAVVERSDNNLPDPDLFIFGVPVHFRGYFPDYHKQLLHDEQGNDRRNHFTWAVLKGHTKNRGCVTLKSDSVYERPHIDFNYFDGVDGEEDLQAVVEGVKFVRRMNSRPAVQAIVKREVLPGDQIQNDAEIAQWVRKEAWGHHACGTCKIGRADDELAVLTGDFKVKGLENLRIVDASIFPEIPGFFIAAPIYLAAEKASRDILRDAGVAELPDVAWQDLPDGYWK